MLMLKRPATHFGPHEKKALEGQMTWVWPLYQNRRVEASVGGPLVHVHFDVADGTEDEHSGPSAELAERIGLRIAEPSRTMPFNQSVISRKERA